MIDDMNANLRFTLSGNVGFGQLRETFWVRVIKIGSGCGNGDGNFVGRMPQRSAGHGRDFRLRDPEIAFDRLRAFAAQRPGLLRTLCYSRREQQGDKDVTELAQKLFNWLVVLYLIAPLTARGAVIERISQFIVDTINTVETSFSTVVANV